MNAFQSFEHAKAEMTRDVAALIFEGTTVTGHHRLISIDLLTGKLKARTAPDAKVSCYINLPTTAGEDAARRMAGVITNPKLVPCLLSDEAWDDLTSTLWAYTNIRLIEHPQSLDGIKLSPEAAALFESRFPQAIREAVRDCHRPSADSSGAIPKASNTDIDIIQCEKSPEAEKIPDAHFLLGLDRQTGETFGNPASKTLDALLCATHNSVEAIPYRDAVLLPLEWLYTEYPKRRQLWEVQRDVLHRYAQKNGLPFTEPF